MILPKISKAKIKSGIFIGSEIRKILEGIECLKQLPTKRRAAWNSFDALVYKVLDNQKVENCI